jgi:hypothetical protein
MWDAFHLSDPCPYQKPCQESLIIFPKNNSTKRGYGILNASKVPIVQGKPPISIEIYGSPVPPLIVLGKTDLHISKPMRASVG